MIVSICSYADQAELFISVWSSLLVLIQTFQYMLVYSLRFSFPSMFSVSDFSIVVFQFLVVKDAGAGSSRALFLTHR